MQTCISSASTKQDEIALVADRARSRRRLARLRKAILIAAALGDDEKLAASLREFTLLYEMETEGD